MTAFSIPLIFLLLLSGWCEGGKEVKEGTPIQVQLKSIAEIREGNVTLGDVVQSTSLSPEEWSKLAGAVLAPAPLLGFERIINRDQILSVFLHQGYDPKGIVLSGPQSVRTFVTGIRIEGSELRVRGENFLCEELERGGQEDFEIEFIGNQSGMMVPRRTSPPQYRIVWEGKPSLKGKVGLLVQVLDAGRVLGQIPLLFRIRSFGKVLVAKERIPRKTVLHGGQFELKRVELTDFNKTPFQDPEDLSGRELCRPVPSGAILAEEDTHCPPLIRKGDLVTVVYASEALLLTAKAKAKESGRKGDWIAVENIDTRKLIFVRIIGPSRVELILTGG